MRLVLVGTSHHLAPVELRELVAVDRDALHTTVGRVRADVAEAVVLSTCNRTELYLAHPDVDVARRRALLELSVLSGLGEAELARAVSTLIDHEAAVHLFRVAAGLESMVRGEGQILGQVREAYEASQQAGATGPVLNRLFAHALRVGKRVRSETSVAENPASISSAADELAERVFGELRGTRVLVLGAGKMSELTAANLISRGAESTFVAGRSPEKAERLAERFGGRWVPLESVEDELGHADVVVASTSARGFVLSAEQVERAMRRRRGRPIFFVDIAVPRDVDPAVTKLDGCYLYDIDDLERILAESLQGRREHALRAETIVAEEANAFRAWHLSLDVVPAIASLRELAERIRVTELARAETRLASLSSSERRAVESLTAQIVNKLLHPPTVRLKEAASTADGTGNALLYADAVRHLFGLRDEER